MLPRLSGRAKQNKMAFLSMLGTSDSTQQILRLQQAAALFCFEKHHAISSCKPFGSYGFYHRPLPNASQKGSMQNQLCTPPLPQCLQNILRWQARKLRLKSHFHSVASEVTHWNSTAHGHTVWMCLPHCNCSIMLLLRCFTHTTRLAFVLLDYLNASSLC